MSHRQTRRITLAACAAVVLSAGPAARAQETNIPAVKPRSTDARVLEGQPTPPPVNSLYRTAAEGKLPATPAGATNLTRPETGDPSTRLQPAVVSLGAGAGAGQPAPGLDVAMLIEHAVGMAIEGSALKAIAEQGPADASPDDPSKMLLDHARKAMSESKALMTRAAADGRGIDAASPARRFYGAANNYLTTLGSLSNMPSLASPADKAQVAMINHSVKEVLDAGHIRQFGRAYPTSGATEQLMSHAREMRDGGMQNVLRIAGNGPTDPAAPASPIILAQRGRELIDAAEQLSNLPAMTPGRNPTAATNPGTGAPTGSNGGIADPTRLFPTEPNPARLQDTRPEIIGGTQATGSPTTGTTVVPKVADPNAIPKADTRSNSPASPGTTTNPR